MAAGTPLTRLTLGAASVADDLGYVALSDLARALGDIPADFRVIGGHMVTMLAARWQLGHELYRETGDVDLGLTPIAARDHHVVGRLKDLRYAQVAGNRFARELSDIPVKIKDKEDSRVPRRSSMSSSRRTQAGRVRTSRSERISSPQRFPGCSSR
jgi:hypothetical protein